VVGVAGRIQRGQLPPAGAEGLTVVQHPHAVGRDREHLAPEAVHIVAVEAGGTGEQPRGVDHVLRPVRVHQELRVRDLAQQGAGRAGVVQVDVRDGDLGDLVRGEAGGADAGEQRVERARRSRLDERQAVVTGQQVGRNDPRNAEEVVVDDPEPGAKLLYRRVGHRSLPVTERHTRSLRPMVADGCSALSFPRSERSARRTPARRAAGGARWWRRATRRASCGPDRRGAAPPPR